MVLEKERTICHTLYHRDEASYGIAQALLNETLAAVGDDPHRAVLLDRQGTLYRLQGEHDKAEQALREAIGIARGKHGPLAVETSRLRSHLCLAFEAAGKAPDAVRKYYQEAVAGAGKVPGAGAALMLELACYEFKRGRLDEAHDLFVRALPELTAATDRLAVTYASTCLRHLGDIKFGRGEYRLARSYYEQAVRYEPALKENLAPRMSDLNYEVEPSYMG
jgi:tetratricopeptide (TPR) repeat protein